MIKKIQVVLLIVLLVSVIYPTPVFASEELGELSIESVADVIMSYIGQSIIRDFYKANNNNSAVLTPSNLRPVLDSVSISRDELIAELESYFYNQPSTFSRFSISPQFLDLTKWYEFFTNVAPVNSSDGGGGSTRGGGGGRRVVDDLGIKSVSTQSPAVSVNNISAMPLSVFLSLLNNRGLNVLANESLLSTVFNGKSIPIYISLLTHNIYDRFDSLNGTIVSWIASDYFPGYLYTTSSSSTSSWPHRYYLNYWFDNRVISANHVGYNSVGSVSFGPAGNVRPLYNNAYSNLGGGYAGIGISDSSYYYQVYSNYIQSSNDTGRYPVLEKYESYYVYNDALYNYTYNYEFNQDVYYNSVENSENFYYFEGLGDSLYIDNSTYWDLVFNLVTNNYDTSYFWDFPEPTPEPTPLPTPTPTVAPVYPDYPTYYPAEIPNFNVPENDDSGFSLWGVVKAIIDAIGGFFNWLLEGIAGIVGGIVEAIGNLLMSLFTVEDDYFSSKIEGYNVTVSGKLGVDSMTASLESLTEVEDSELLNINGSYSVPGQQSVQVRTFNSNEVTFVDFSIFREYADTFRGWINGFFNILLIFYNLNHVLFLIRGTYVFPSVGGDSGNEVKGKKD